MREYNIDLVIDKTFTVMARTRQEAKEFAIERARNLMGTYNSLCIDHIEVVKDDCEFENEYSVQCYNFNGKLIHTYSIEADNSTDAKSVAMEFFADDFAGVELGELVVSYEGKVRQ